MQIDLSGRVALVTGAGRGIGKSISIALANSGADLAVVDINKQTAEATGREIASLGRRAIGLQADVSKSGEADLTVARAAEALGKVDILVNNAGIVVRKAMEDYTDEDWDNVMNVNLKGVFNFSRAVGRLMIRQGKGGRIISIASIMGLVALPPRASYVSSKGGIVALTRDLAAEWARHNITVNCICPGWVKTEMTGPYFAQPEVGKYLLDRVPLGRFAEPAEIAGVVVFLASDLSGYITGQSIAVDGGWTAL